MLKLHARECAAVCRIQEGEGRETGWQRGAKIGEKAFGLGVAAMVRSENNCPEIRIWRIASFCRGNDPVGAFLSAVEREQEMGPRPLRLENIRSSPKPRLDPAASFGSSSSRIEMPSVRRTSITSSVGASGWKARSSFAARSGRWIFSFRTRQSSTASSRVETSISG